MATAPRRRPSDPPSRRPGRPLPPSGRRGPRRPLPPVLRDPRAAAGLLALLVAAVVAALALGGGDAADDAPPARRAAALVPADALAFVDLSTDGDRAATGRALALLDRLGAGEDLRARAADLLRGGSQDAVPVDLDRDVRPWLGDEAALALTTGRGTTAGSLLLLAVRDEDAARAFLRRTAGRARRARHRGTTTETYPNGTVAAFLDGFLAVGQVASVRGAIDLAAASGAGSLAASADYRAATAQAPDDAVAEAWASVDGVRRLFAAQPGLLGLAGALLDQRGLRGTAVALVPGEGTATLRVRAVLDPDERGATRAFEPTLDGAVPADALAYAGFAGLDRAAPLLLGLGGLGGGGEDTAALLREASRMLGEQGVSFARDVLPLLGSEVAVVLLDVDGTATPVLVARTPDEARVRGALRRLEPALARLFAPAGGDAPSFGDASAGGVAVRRLAAGGGGELAYALADGRLVASTSAAAVGAAARPGRAIDSDPEYEAVIPDSQSKLTSIVFFDFSQLLSLFEPLGLTGDSGLPADLQRVRAVGLTSMSGEAHTTAELTFEIP